MSSLYWLSCLERLFWIGRVVERLGTLQSLEKARQKKQLVTEKGKLRWRRESEQKKDEDTSQRTLKRTDKLFGSEDIRRQKKHFSNFCS